MNWQPIKTALKDGTYILIYDSYLSIISIARWYGEWELSDHYFYGAEGSFVYSDINQKKITHWMPLPEPPKL